METPATPSMPPAGPLMRLCMKLAAADGKTLLSCPQQEWDNVRAIGEILICTWLYQASLFLIISHKLFAAPGEISPLLIAVSIFIASFILSIDSYMFMRSGWHLNGIEELKRGGIDISGGRMKRIKAGFFLAIRICLSVGLAELTAIFLSLLVFGMDINARIEATYLKANADIARDATGLVDDGIRQTTGAVTAQNTRVETLAAQVTALRQNEIDPSSPQLQQAQDEVTRLVAQKAKADDEQRTAETFASNEAGGIKGGAGNSGLPGCKARCRAAQEQAASARKRGQDTAQALEAARSRLDTLRDRLNGSNEALMQRSREALPAFEAKLTAEETQLADLKAQLASAVRGRDKAIRTAIENAPNHVGREDGLLNQLAILKQIADGDPTMKTVILLIDITSFGFELAAVLAKVMSYVPTSYAAMVARDTYLRIVRVVDEMMAELERKDRTAGPDGVLTEVMAHPVERMSGYDPVTDIDPFEPNAALQSPPKRPRGRPRKDPLN